MNQKVQPLSISAHRHAHAIGSLKRAKVLREAQEKLTKIEDSQLRERILNEALGHFIGIHDNKPCSEGYFCPVINHRPSRERKPHGVLQTSDDLDATLPSSVLKEKLFLTRNPRNLIHKESPDFLHILLVFWTNGSQIGNTGGLHYATDPTDLYVLSLPLEGTEGVKPGLRRIESTFEYINLFGDKLIDWQITHATSMEDIFTKIERRRFVKTTGYPS